MPDHVLPDEVDIVPTAELIAEAMPHKFKHNCSPKGGRPSKCTKRRAKVIQECMAKGMTFYAACEKAGTSHKTVRQWLKKGKGEIPCDDPRPYQQFVKYLEMGKAIMQEECLDTIHEVRKGGYVTSRTIVTRPDGSEVVTEKVTPPRAEPAQWLLERRAPGFSNRTKVEHSGTVRNENINLTMAANLSDADAMTLVRLLEQAQKGLIEQQ